jgi:ABC-type uncharacterized transport system substrate-binding protein
MGGSNFNPQYFHKKKKGKKERKEIGPDVMAHTCNLSYLKELWFEASPGKKRKEPHLN